MLGTRNGGMKGGWKNVPPPSSPLNCDTSNATFAVGAGGAFGACAEGAPEGCTTLFGGLGSSTLNFASGGMAVFGRSLGLPTWSSK